MANVRNYTIGDPSQPGKMVILNGNLDVYNASGQLVISNGDTITGFLAYTSDGTVKTGIDGNGAIITGYNTTYTVPAGAHKTVKITGRVNWWIDGGASANAQAQFVVIDENASAKQLNYDFSNGSFNNRTYYFTYYEFNVVPGAYTRGLQVYSGTSSSTIAVRNAGNGGGYLAVELI